MKINTNQVTESKNVHDRLVDYGDTEICCSNCKKLLVKFKTIALNDNIISNIVAICPYCKDKSFVTTTSGRFAFIEVDGLKLVDFPMAADSAPDGKIVQNVRVITHIV